eukprot:2961742-Rhodomonas_salina.1
MVAMLLQDGPMTQKEILDEAEATAISKETMYASAGCHYDGWSSHMKLINNDLMKQQRVNKGKAQYTLTQEGKDLADAMHKWAHRDGKCKCGAQQESGRVSAPPRWRACLVRPQAGAARPRVQPSGLQPLAGRIEGRGSRTVSAT